MALNGQASTQKAQPSQFSSMGVEMMESISNKSLDSTVLAREAQARASATDSWMGSG